MISTVFIRLIGESTWKLPFPGNCEWDSDEGVVVSDAFEFTVGELVLPRDSNLLVTVIILKLLNLPVILEVIFDQWLESIGKSTHS